MENGGDRRSDQSLNLDSDNIPVKKAASMLNVSRDSVFTAKRVMREAPEKIRDIESGKTTLNRARRRSKDRFLFCTTDTTGADNYGMKYINVLLICFLISCGDHKTAKTCHEIFKYCVKNSGDVAGCSEKLNRCLKYVERFK